MFVSKWPKQICWNKHCQIASKVFCIVSISSETNVHNVHTMNCMYLVHKVTAKRCPLISVQHALLLTLMIVSSVTPSHRETFFYLFYFFKKFLFAFYIPIPVHTSSSLPSPSTFPSTSPPIYSSWRVRFPIGSQQCLTYFIEEGARPSQPYLG